MTSFYQILTFSFWGTAKVRWKDFLTFIFPLCFAHIFCVLFKFGKGPWSHYHSRRMASHREVQSHCARTAGSLGSITSKCKMEVLIACWSMECGEILTPLNSTFLFWQRYFYIANVEPMQISLFKPLLRIVKYIYFLKNIYIIMHQWQ